MELRALEEDMAKKVRLYTETDILEDRAILRLVQDGELVATFEEKKLKDAQRKADQWIKSYEKGENTEGDLML